MAGRFKDGSVPSYHIRRKNQTKSNCIFTLEQPPLTSSALTVTKQHESPAAAVVPERKKKSIAQNIKSLNNKKTRPSLSEQLAAIGAQAQKITNSLTGPEGTVANVLLSTPARSFKVGRLECKYPSPIQFFNDKCVYLFHYQSREVTMVMYYRDMRRSIQWQTQRRTLKFKVPNALEQFSVEDYNCHNSQHFIEIHFASRENFDQAKKIIDR